MSSDQQFVEDKILKVLEVYPKLSPSMIQIGIGSSLPTAVWRPVLEEMIKDGKVQRDIVCAINANKRLQNFTVISLTSNPKVSNNASGESQ